MHFNNRHIVILASLFILFGSLFSCTSVEKVRTGKQAMDRKQYAVASKLLLEEMESSKGLNRAEKAYLLAEAYRYTNQVEKALKWYLVSSESGKKSDLLTWNTAMMYKQTGDYENAIIHLNKISKSLSQTGQNAAREKNICKQAINWVKRDNAKYEVQPVEETGSGSSYISSFSEDGSPVITSDRKNSFNNKKFKWTGRNYTNIYFLRQNEYESFDALPSPINTAFNEGGACFNSDFSEIYFTRCSNDRLSENFCKIYKSKKIEGEWQEARLLNFNKEGINYGHPYLSGDSVLFFSCNDPSGPGGYDIYFTKRNKYSWAKPILLPSNINTAGNEKFPTLHEDTLYFSSDFLPGLGGLDIFKIYLMKDGRWSPPENLMPPINSSVDDFSFLIDPTTGNSIYAYFNSSRYSDDRGLDNIYRVKKLKSYPKDIKDTTIIEEKSKKYKLFLSLKVVEKVFESEADPNSRVIGKKPIPSTKGSFIPESIHFTTKKDGRYITEIEFDKAYTILLQKENYLQTRIKIPKTRIPQNNEGKEIQSISIVAEMIKAVYNTEIELQDIFYDLDKWDIRADAVPALHRLAQLLSDNPELNIMIGSHTDCRADDDYNYLLSEKRALSVVNFLKEMGISESRLSYKGYGKSKMIEACPCETCTEKQHQKNRRTTFTLIQ